MQVLPREVYLVAPITRKQVHDLLDMRMLIARATGNDRLVAIVGGLLDGMERFMYASYLLRERDAAASQEHDELIEALIAGDGERAERLMRSGILFAREFVLAALHASKALQSVNLFAANSP